MPAREKLVIDKFMNAESVRKFKNEGHVMIRNGNTDVRIKIVKASEKVHLLEESLRKISNIREKRKSLKDAMINSEKLHYSRIIRERVRQSAFEQDSKLSHNSTIKREIDLILPNIKKSNKSSESMNPLSLSPPSKTPSKTPEIIRKNIKFFNPGLVPLSRFNIQ